MLIDGFTVVAQIVNFLIILLLLRRFLYKPVLRVMSEREEKIATELAEAEALKEKATAEADSYRQQQEELTGQREELLAEARQEAETWRKDFVSRARQEIGEMRAGWVKGIEAERESLTQELRREVGRQVVSISRRALADLSEAEIERQAVQVFLRRLGELEENEQKRLTRALENSRGQVVVWSAFELSAADRQGILRAVEQAAPPSLDGGLEVEFKVNPDLVFGVELSLQDYKLAWTLDDYLASLEEGLLEALVEGVGQEHAG